MNMNLMLAIGDRQLLTEALPCPFCGSTDLLAGEMWLTFESTTSIECASCGAMAPFDSWQQRVKS